MLLNFVDKNFDVKRIIQYRLSIQISLNGFSFCVFDDALSKHVALRTYQYNKHIGSYDDLINEIDSIFSKDTLLQLEYFYCICSYISPKHTLIPIEFFAEEKLRSYLEFIAPLEELDEIHYHNFSKTNICSVFAVPSQIASKLASYYKNIRFINQSDPLIYDCLNNKEKQDSIYVNLHDGVADIALIANKQFKLHNSFVIYHLNDAVYYITALLLQFYLTPQAVTVYISGDILKEEIEELTKYFPLLKVSTHHRMSMLVGYENSYRYFNLLMTYKCE